MLVRRIGTVLARVSPAGFTTVPMTVSTPSASSWAIAAAARGVPVMAAIVQRRVPDQFWRPSNSVTNRSMKPSNGVPPAGRMTNFVNPASM